MTELTASDLTIGATFRAKRPRRVGNIFAPQLNDRTVIWKGPGVIQYDGPAVKLGSKYPTTTTEKFLKWADRKLKDGETSKCPT